MRRMTALRTRPRIVGAALLLAGLTVVGGAAALSWLSDSGEPTSDEARVGEAPTRAPATAASTTELPAQSTPRGVAAVTVVEGQRVIDLGRIFAVGSSDREPVADVDGRDALAIVELVDGTQVDLSHSGLPWVTRVRTPLGITVTTPVGQRQLDLQINAYGDTELVGPGARIDVRADGSALRVVVQAGWHGPNGTQLAAHVKVAEDGTVFVAEEPLPATAIVLRNTGEVLNTASAIWQTDVFGERSGLRFANQCPAVTQHCELSVSDDTIARATHPVPAPLSGMLTCRDDGVLQIDGAFRLQISVEDQDGRDLGGCFPTRVAPVTEGDVVLDARFIHLRAFTLDGDPLSVVSTSAGTILAGPIAPREPVLQ